jgi:hypothetical protein
MKIIIIKNLLLLSVILSSTQLLAQIMDPVQMKSPQSYAFEKYGNVPVNLYTGAIDLKIPVANIGGSDADISATLIYDSSGFIPHKKSDAAGVNWSLMAGGRITRKMNVIPDEYVGEPLLIGNANNPYGQAAHLHGFLKGIRSNPPSSNTSAYNISGTGTGHTNGTEWLMGSDPNNNYEGEPDEFSFNVMGLSGKFMIGNDGKVLVESSDPNVKVDLSQMALYEPAPSACVPPAASIITLTDGKGNKYIFGGDLSKYEISYSYTILPQYPNDTFTGYPMINSFSLAKVILANKKEITFDYEEGTLSNEYFCSLSNWDNLRDNGKMLSMDSYTQDGGRSDSWPDCDAGGCTDPSDIANFFFLPSKTTTFSMLKKSVLKSIKYQDDEIRINYLNTGYPIMHFTLSPLFANRIFNEWVIGSVETYHKNLMITKQELSYDHLGGEFKRPFLKSIKELKSNQTYSFEYYKTDNLPAYYTKGIDHWGYWNGLDNNVSLSPFDTATTYGDYTLNNTFRDTDAEKYNVALLKTITYPTKGFSVFEYEPQVYAKRIERIAANSFLPALIPNGGLAGGARIKRISSRNESGVLYSDKQYKYTTTLNGSIGSGILMTWPRYYYHIQMLSVGMPRELLLKASSNVQVNSLDSYNVGYSKVFEIENGKGYIQNDFSTYETHPDLITSDPYNNTLSTNGMTNIHPVDLYANLKNLYGTDKSILRGRPLSQKYFSQADLVNPIKTVDYEYYDNMEYNPNSSVDNNNYVSVNHSSGVWTQAYKRYMNSSPTKKITTTEYLGSTQIITKSENVFDNPIDLNLSKTNNTSSDNSITQTNYIYATGSSPLVTANMLSVPLKTEVKKDGKMIFKQETKYENSSPAELFPSSEISYDIQNPSVTNTDILYDKYDNKGNLQQYTSKNGISTTIIWGYNQTKPIAKIVGAKLSDIQQSLIDAVVSASLVDNSAIANNDETSFIDVLDNFRKDTSLANYQVTTYTYDPLIGVRSITPPSGIRENYLYDTANRLKKVIDINGNVLKEYKYNYNASKIYYNSEASWVFTNTSCGNNAIGSPFTYTVPAYKYTSVISQNDADQKAQIDISTNGQNIANTNSTCTPFSCPITFNSSIGISGSGSISANNTNGYYNVTLSINTGPNSDTFLWDEDPGVKIATISGSCRPTYEVYSYNTAGDVFYTIKPNGDVYIQSFNPFPNNTPKTYELELYFNN